MPTIRQRKGRLGGVTYHVQVRLTGAPARTRSFDRLADAQDWARKQEAEALVERRRHTGPKTLGDAIERFTTSVLPSRTEATRETQARLLGWWYGHHGGTRLCDLTPELLSRIRDEHRDRASGPTANRYMRMLSVVLEACRREWGWMHEENPVRRVKLYPEHAGVLRYLEAHEVRALLAAAKARNAVLHAMVLVAAYTGMRRGEILGLRWPEVDLARAVIRLPRTKSHHARGVPLAAEVVELLRAWPHRIGSELVFPAADGERYREVHGGRDLWLQVVAAAGIRQPLRFHDLRHTFASHAAMAGATTRELQDLLGHSSPAMASRYAHLSPAHVAGISALVAERLRSGDASIEVAK